MKQHELIKELVLLANSVFEGELTLVKAKEFIDSYDRINKELDNLIKNPSELIIPDDIWLLASNTIRYRMMGEGLMGVAKDVYVGYHMRLKMIKQQTAG